MPNRQAGFTLVEIAIVLVIIGLLLGGVLKGQELINSAKVKNFAQDFRSVPLFIYGYQDKFKALPGDDKAATTHLCDASAATTCTANGNGDGKIDGAWSSEALTDESVRFWQQVRLANLASGSTDFTSAETAKFPTNADGGRIGVQSGTPPITGMTGSYFVCSAGIQGKYAKQLDTTMDDGDTANGSMRVGASGSSPMTAVPTTGTGGIVDGNTYAVCLAF